MAAWSLKKADLTDKIDKPAMEAAAWGFESLQGEGGGVKSKKYMFMNFISLLLMHYFLVDIK